MWSWPVSPRRLAGRAQIVVLDGAGARAGQHQSGAGESDPTFHRAAYPSALTLSRSHEASRLLRSTEVSCVTPVRSGFITNNWLRPPQVDGPTRWAASVPVRAPLEWWHLSYADGRALGSKVARSGIFGAGRAVLAEFRELGVPFGGSEVAAGKAAGCGCEVFGVEVPNGDSVAADRNCLTV